MACVRISAASLSVSLAVGAASLGACGDDIPSADGSSGPLPAGDDTGAATPPGVTGASSGNADTEADSGSADVDDTADTGFDPPVVECGNGFVEGDEQCDDANRVDDDACNNTCQVPCGLDIASIALPPTDESVISAEFVASDPDDGAVVAGLLRRITADQRGNVEVDPDVVQVLHYDASGRELWAVEVANPDGSLSPAGVAISSDGAITVAATGDSPDGGKVITVVQLSGATGDELWRHDVPNTVMGADDVASGIAVTADDDILVSGQVRVGDGDDDVWVRKLSAADGSELWTSSYSGTGTPQFSTDDGGPVTVDADGRVWVLGLEYVDFETVQPVLLRFAADGGPPELAELQTLPGTEQKYFVQDIVGATAGGIHMLYGRVLGGGTEYHLARMDGDAAEVWSLDGDAFPGEGSDVRIRGIAASGEELVVAGTITNDVTISDSGWNEVWVARVRDDATTRCQAQYRGETRGLVPPSLDAADAAVAGNAQGLVSGIQTVEGDDALWLGRFRSE